LRAVGRAWLGPRGLPLESQGRVSGPPWRILDRLEPEDRDEVSRPLLLHATAEAGDLVREDGERGGSGRPPLAVRGRGQDPAQKGQAPRLPQERRIGARWAAGDIGLGFR